MGQGESHRGDAMTIMPYKDALARFDAVEVSMIEDAVNKFGDGAGGVDRNTFVRCCLTVLPDKIQHVKPTLRPPHRSPHAAYSDLGLPI